MRDFDRGMIYISKDGKNTVEIQGSTENYLWFKDASTYSQVLEKKHFVEQFEPLRHEKDKSSKLKEVFYDQESGCSGTVIHEGIDMIVLRTGPTKTQTFRKADFEKRFSKEPPVVSGAEMLEFIKLVRGRKKTHRA